MVRIFILFILFTSIIKAQVPGKPPLILFERLYSNPKEPYHIHGEIIDKYGNVHIFDNKDDKPGVKYREWNLGKKQFEPFNWLMTTEEIQKNLSLTDSIVSVMSPDTLSKYVHLLNLIAESNQNYGNTLVVSGTSSAEDIQDRSTTLYGFIYDSTTKMYKRILIEYHRGIEWENQTGYIRELKQWIWWPHPQPLSKGEGSGSN